MAFFRRSVEIGQTPREKVEEKILKPADAVRRLNAQWRKEGLSIEINLNDFVDYQIFYNGANTDEELEVLPKSEEAKPEASKQLLTVTMGDVKEKLDLLPFVKRFYEMKTLGTKAFDAWARNTQKIKAYARIHKSVIHEDYY